MPELPEVETIRRTLAPLLRGRVIIGAEVYTPRTIGYPELTNFLMSIVGQEISDVIRRGKLVVLEMRSGDALTVHLRMTGALRYYAGGPPEPDPEVPYVRARFRLDGTDELTFYDVRRFGRIQLLTTDEWMIRSESMGAEPLDGTFTVEVLASILSSRSRRIKPLLLDQTVIAGIGNIYADESLFRAGISPISTSSAVPIERIVSLHDAIVDILSESIEHRGTTLRDYRSGLGEAGENQTRLLVYGRPSGAPCPRCATPLERTVVGQRGTVFCPHCQPEFT